MAAENKSMREQHGHLKEQAGSEGQNKYRFGNYDLVHRIDVGGMGEVYLARQRTAFDREVAIKIMRPDLVHDITARRRFLREAEVNAHIKHEHILPLFEFGEEQGRLFLVTPYIAGGTLVRRLQSGPLTLSEVYQLFTALVQAVAYIHRRGVIHRDLKPSNILLDQEENTGQVYVRLIDFGIATIQGMLASPPLTSAGTEMGTVAYMAPERLSGIAAPSNDIYSLGVILYQMLTGRLPMDEEPVKLPQPLEYVVAKCMATDPNERFNRAEDLLSAFEYAYQYLNASPQEATASVREPAHVVRTNTPRPGGNTKPELRAAQRSDIALSSSSRSQQANTFERKDYEAPTATVNMLGAQGKHNVLPMPAAVPPAPGRSSRSPHPRRSPLIAILTLFIVFVLLAIAGLFAFEYQSMGIGVVSANINFGPQVHAVQQVFQIKGSLSQQTVDGTTATIPVRTESSSKTASQSGPTTRACLIPPVIDCQQVVAPADVDKLSAQVKQSLDKQIRQDLQQRLDALRAVQVGSTQTITTSKTFDPPIGTLTNTVTVTLTEQGKVAYYLNSDAQKVARQLLTQKTQQLGANYDLLGSSIQIGQPVLVGVNSDGVVTIEVPAGGIAQYHFPPAQLESIQKRIEGLKLKNALAALKREPGVDANTVSIHLSSGDTLPGDSQQIKIIPLNPGSLPPVVLPTVKPTATS